MTADNAAVLAALGEGRAPLIRGGESGVRLTGFTALLSGVYLEPGAVILDAGADYRPACDVMLALVAQLDPGQRDTLRRSTWGRRPADGVVARSSRPADRGGRRGRTSGGRRTLRKITVDGPVNNLGDRVISNSRSPSRPRWPTAGAHRIRGSW